MSNRSNKREPEDHSDEDSDEEDLNDDDWDDDSDEEATIECPHCGREIHEDAQRCPHCEQYLSAEDGPRPRKPWWIVLGVVLCLVTLLWWLF